jgi:hypothetical protein
MKGSNFQKVEQALRDVNALRFIFSAACAMKQREPQRNSAYPHFHCLPSRISIAYLAFSNARHGEARALHSGIQRGADPDECSSRQIEKRETHTAGVPRFENVQFRRDTM